MAQENWNFQANTLLVHQLLKYFSILKIIFLNHSITIIIKYDNSFFFCKKNLSTLKITF